MVVYLSAGRRIKNGTDIKEIKEFYNDGSLKARYFFLENLQHGPVEEYDLAGRITRRQYFHKNALIFHEVYNQNGTGLDTIFRSFSPIIELSKDTIAVNDAIAIFASLPLPDSFFQDRQYILKFDFLPEKYVDSTTLYYADYSIPLSPIIQKREFVVEDTGSVVMYGYLVRSETDSINFTTSHLKRNFYVAPIDQSTVLFPKSAIKN